MTNTKKRIQVKTGVKAGGVIVQNHNTRRLAIKTGVKAGGVIVQNHNTRAR